MQTEDGGATSAEIGAVGGNVGLVDGSVSWRKVNQMSIYRGSQQWGEQRLLGHVVISTGGIRDAPIYKKMATKARAQTGMTKTSVKVRALDHLPQRVAVAGWPDSKQESVVRTMSQLFSGLRFRLLLLVVLASLPPVVLTLHIARQDRQRQTAALRQRSQDMVKLAARKEDEMIAGTRQLLHAVAASSQVQLGRWGDCNKLLRTLFADYPRYANLGVIKTNGDVLASALPLTNTVNLADRPYFQRALSSRAFSIGDFQVGRITGKPTVNFGYPVFDPAGQVQAVVFAALDLDWVNRSDYALQMQLPEGATWTKIDRNGTILVRYPAPETSLVGQPLPEKSLLKTFLTRNSGVVEAMDPKGIPGLHDFASTRSALVAGDVITILSIPRKVLFAEADRRLTGNLTGLGIAAGFAFLLGWIGSYFLVLRPVRTLVKSSARLATGDLSTRTGLCPPGR